METPERLWSGATKAEGEKGKKRWRPLTRLWSGETKRSQGEDQSENGRNDDGVGRIGTAG